MITGAVLYVAIFLAVLLLAGIVALTGRDFADDDSVLAAKIALLSPVWPLIPIWGFVHFFRVLWGVTRADKVI